MYTKNKPLLVSRMLHRFLHSFFLSVLVVLAFCGNLQALESEYQFEFTDLDNAPVSAVRIEGTHGVQELAGNMSGVDGLWYLNFLDLFPNLKSGEYPRLIFTKPGFTFDKQDFEVNFENCPGYICRIKAISSETGTSLLKLNFVDQNSLPLENLKLRLSNSNYNCGKKTDYDGGVLFSSDELSGTCNDFDDNPDNDFRKILFNKYYSDGKECTFTNLPITICPNNSYDSALVNANCVSKSYSVSENQYLIIAKDERGNAIDRLGLMVLPETNSNNPNYVQTDRQGQVLIDKSATGDKYKIIPFGFFEFMPIILDVNKNTCPNNVCHIYGHATLRAQDVQTVLIRDNNGTPLSGIKIKYENNYSCSEGNTLISDKRGRVYFPITRQLDCSDQKYTTKLLPESPNCVLSHESDTPFSTCNTSSPTELQITASCNADTNTRKVEGRIYTALGTPYARIPVTVNGVEVTTTREDGSYTINVDKGNTVVVKPKVENVLFDPNQVQLTEVSENIKLNFQVAAGNGELPQEPNDKVCEAKDKFTITGTVFDLDGNRLQGVSIYNNHTKVIETDSEGNYTFDVVAHTDNWVTAEFNDQAFDPAGASLPFIACDENNVNFQLSNTVSHTLQGKAVLRNGQLIPELQLQIVKGEVEKDITTDSNGLFRESIEADLNFVITENDRHYQCTPSQFSGISNQNFTGFLFTCDFDECVDDATKLVPGACGCGVPDTDADNDGTPDCNDECELDPEKTERLQCGCGVPETDTDNDGIADCNDQCLEDPLKFEPGVCGCGVVEDPTDSDGDGTADCVDFCPSDPLKTDVGVCGCGQSDVDNDGDTISDCQDLCPSDSGKIAPGICGCGVADNDSDSDGTMDCIDLCPNDPDKIVSGTCGCGVSENDADGDGTLDCEDECPEDPLKLNPGECGCGTQDIDSDTDGTLNCFDECPFDPNKQEEGLCGCHISDADGDGDGIPNCIDSCPENPGKSSYGQCGCYIDDIDDDNDGTANCIDSCPQDPNKRWVGECGCGVSDIDSDEDSTPDCHDECPKDKNKVLPGECGCGVSDADTDADGTLDCREECPNDPLKTENGICGCGTSDIDTDGDGLADCKDFCPLDKTKIVEGVCGCRSPDINTDGDSRYDCEPEEKCPLDPLKLEPGQCGCGNLDTDLDGDKVADCIDLCPKDSSKINEGICGCGIADTDEDGDGVPDCKDECPTDKTRVVPGKCGCNAPDSDNDGAPDCDELCDNDPNKTTPGACGCGNPDTDADSDGFADCNDSCPNDVYKQEPGSCGCGVLDIDSDGDTYFDCNDACPNDFFKKIEGICGCGVADVDSDLDGIVNCKDECPYDSFKTDAGTCGCGVLDNDSDNDGTPDCIDACPDSYFKTEPGQCGCGVRDVDTDADGQADCVDECPYDQNKHYPGICGCNYEDTDFDSDGMPDCIDECPRDPFKVDYGECGCGKSDIDRNSNGIADCKELELTLTPICIENPEDNSPKENVDLCKEGASSVIKYVHGKGANDAPEPDLNRQYSSKALGVPEYNDTMNFVSLGRGGYIILGFNGKVLKDKEGPDFKVIETSWKQRFESCETYKEEAEIYVTNDNVNWHKVALLCRDGEVDFSATGLSEISAIKILDVTTKIDSDGYDVDGIACPENTGPENPAPEEPSPEPTGGPGNPEPSPEPTDSPPPGNDDEWECDNGIGASKKCDDDRSDDDDDHCKNGKGDCNERVIICHQPPGNRENRNTLTVSINSVEAHLAHGDYLGECVEESQSIFAKSTVETHETESMFAKSMMKTHETESVKWKVINPNPVGFNLAFKHNSANPEDDIYLEIGENTEIIFSTPSSSSLDSDGHTLTMFVDEIEKATVTHPSRYCNWEPPVTHTIIVKVRDENGEPVNRKVILGNPKDSGPDTYREVYAGLDGNAVFENMDDNLEYTVFIDKGCEHDITPSHYANTLTEDVTHEFTINRVRDLKPYSICGLVTHRGLPLVHTKVDATDFLDKLTDEDGYFWYEEIEEGSQFKYFTEKPGYSFSNQPENLLIDENKRLYIRAKRDEKVSDPSMYSWVSGEIKTRKGRKIRPGSKFAKRLSATLPKILISARGDRNKHDIQNPFNFIHQIILGKRYTAKIAGKDYIVRSRPRRYTFRVTADSKKKVKSGRHFALDNRGTKFFRKRQKRSRELREARNQ